jgi:hypothetical protein
MVTCTVCCEQYTLGQYPVKQHKPALSCCGCQLASTDTSTVTAQISTSPKQLHQPQNLVYDGFLHGPQSRTMNHIALNGVPFDLSLSHAVMSSKSSILFKLLQPGACGRSDSAAPVPVRSAHVT